MAPEQSSQPVQPNRVDELANSHLKAGRTLELETELTSMRYDSLSAEEQESWWHIYGIIAFQTNRGSAALERLQRGYELFPQSVQIRFSLGQQYIRAGFLDEGFALFRTCQFPEVSRRHAFAEARYAYLFNHYEDAWLFIKPFLNYYAEAKILDDTFVHMRGLPFFGQWWSYVAAFSILSGDIQRLEEVAEFVKTNCQKYDFDYLGLELRAFRENAPELLLGALEERAALSPSGYTQLQIAAVRALTAPTQAASSDLISAVPLSARDFPWLEDIRTLALAAAAHRFDDSAREGELVKKFLTRQPMLFEPDNALNFHLLRYQERLKPQVSLR